MVKEASLPFNILGSTSVSATTTITSSVSNIMYRDSVCYQINASGAPTGILQINASTDYSPGYPQGSPGGAAVNAGNWATVASISVTAATSFPVIFDLNQLSMPWSQCQFISSTSSGVISVWTSAKSLG